MERYPWGILQHCKQKICLKESDFGVLSHKFFLIATAGKSCLCARLFCSAAHWDYRRQVLAPRDAGKCYFLGVCSLSHQVLLRVGLEDNIYKIQHFLLFLSSLSLACECISPHCKDFHRHQTRTGWDSQPKITASDLFIFLFSCSLSPSLPCIFLLLDLPFPIIFPQDVLPINLQDICYCTAKGFMHSPFSFFFSLSYFLLIFSPKQHSPLELICTTSYRS